MSLDICSICSKIVKNNQQVVSCDCCLHWIHAKCMLISSTEYGILGSINEAWFCSSCLKQLFVFNSIDDDDEFHSTITGEDTALVLSRSLSFKPFTLTDKKYLGNSEDLDPENNFYINNDKLLPDSLCLSSKELSSILSVVLLTQILCLCCMLTAEV